MAQPLPSGSWTLAEETQKMDQSELMRGQEREPSTHSRTCSPKTQIKHGCPDTVEGPLNIPSGSRRGEFGGLGSVGRVLQFTSRCLARFRPDPQRLPGGQRLGISPGGREARVKLAEPLTLAPGEVGDALFPTGEGAQGGFHGPQSWETSGPGSERPAGRRRVMQLTEHRHLSVEWIADFPGMHQSTILQAIFNSVLLNLR